MLGRQRAVLALAAIPSTQLAASSPREGSFVPCPFSSAEAPTRDIPMCLWHWVMLFAPSFAPRASL